MVLQQRKSDPVLFFDTLELKIKTVSITIGILASFWIDYGTHYIGGTRCSPRIPYTGGTTEAPTFDPYTDVGPNGCTGQSTAAWRIPLALQILPAIILSIGMFFYPDTPRWLLLQERDEDAFKALSKLRRLSADHPSIVSEALDIKASILMENTYIRDHYAGYSGLKSHAAQVISAPYPSISQARHELTISVVSFSLHPKITFSPSSNRMLRYVLPTIHGL